MEQQKKLVSLCLVILFISLIVIYSLLYQVRGTELLARLQPQDQSSNWWISPRSASETNWNTDQIVVLDFGEQHTTEASSGDVLSWVNNSNTSATWSDAWQVALGDQTQSASTETDLLFQGQAPRILSGTDMYFGVVESIDMLGLTPEYLLRDARGIYYAYFAKAPSELKTTIQQLGGNIYSMKSESEIVKHQLFGDKLSYLNLPEYKEKLVIILLEINGEHWLLQIPYAKYHQSKSYLKSLFI